MWRMKTLVLIFLCSIPVSAQQYMEAGTGLWNETQKQNSDVKFIEYGGIAVGNRYNLLGGVGHWWDASHYFGAKDSFYFRTGLGVAIRTLPLCPSLYFGPAFITSPDTVLATNFQFALEGNLMLIDNRSMGLGITIKHFSNAGIVQPNIGRNFVGARVLF